VKKLLAALAILLLPALAAAQSQPSNVFGIDFSANNAQAVSAASHARLRYNSGTNVIEASLNGAAYVTFGTTATLASTYAAGTGTASSIMLLDSTRGPVIVRDSSPSSGSPLFAVQNNGGSSFLSITPTSQQFIRSGAADGAASVGLGVDTFVSWSNATSKILRVLTGGAERLSVTGPGNINTVDGAVIQDTGGSAKLTLGTTGLAARLNFGAGSMAVTSTAVTFDPNNGVADFNAEVRPRTSFGTGLTLGSASFYWTGAFVGVLNNKAKASTTAAIASWSDSSGNARYGVDVEGLPSLGSNYKYQLSFLCGLGASTSITLTASQTNQTPTGCSPDWIYSTSANATGSVASSGLAANSPVNGLSLGSGTASTNFTLARSIQFVNPQNLTNLEIVFEEPVNVSTAGTGANSAYTVKVGLVNSNLTAANPGGYYFQKTSASANWFCVTDDGAANTPVDTTVAFTTNVQMLRIEYYGSGTTVAGGTKTVKFYIDSTLVCTRTANVFSTGPVGWNAYITATGAIAQQSLGAGPAILQYNEVAAALIP
jgi:hypothetical protein